MSPSPAHAAEALRKKIGRVPAVALILGSGFASVLDCVRDATSVSTSDLPGFPQISVRGHSPNVVCGQLGGCDTLLLGGRAHCYEGYSAAEVAFPVRVLAALGIRTIVLTNAAGAINESFRPGEFMAVADHINFTGTNPLVGDPSGDAWHVDLTSAYDPTLRNQLHAAARVCGIALREGVYIAVNGPSYETPAEIKAFRIVGADAVGMSTVHEVIVARQCGMRVVALSCLTNMAAGLSSKTLSHSEVLECGRSSAVNAARLLEAFLALIATSARSSE